MAIKDMMALGKGWIAIVAALSAATGAAAFAGRGALSADTLASVFGTLLTAMGACALNQWQDRHLDSRMERTRGRPIPSGRVAPGQAFAAAVGLLIAGLLLLGASPGLAPAGLGALAVAWYNGVYAALKRVTPFAAVAGALVGAIPPLIGWVSAGGAVLDREALGLGLLFWLWQLPHFWLLLLRIGPELESAGLPSLTTVLRPLQLGRVAVAWAASAGGMAALLPVVGLGRTEWAPAYSVLGLAFAVAAGALLARGRAEERRLRLAFWSSNAYLLAVMGLLIADRLLRTV